MALQPLTGNGDLYLNEALFGNMEPFAGEKERLSTMSFGNGGGGLPGACLNFFVAYLMKRRFSRVPLAPP